MLPLREGLPVPLAKGRCLSVSLAFLAFAAAFLAEVLLGVSLAADLLGLFPSPSALGAPPDSRRVSHWTVAFLFAEEQAITPGVPPEGEEGVEASALGCPGVPPAGLPLAVPTNLLGSTSCSNPVAVDSGE